MTETRGRDPLTPVVERAIEQQLPGGTYGVDIPSMAREVVREVRRQLALERLLEITAKLAGDLDRLNPARKEEASGEGT
ncbi:hypothetical protein AB0N09_05050 [Streptomyces erythrochromogenes]|uniref:hypothetical protein n=1 Tax=Streptomyces erythrochromogenes TaxID=285574 RepID=UPI00342AFA2E